MSAVHCFELNGTNLAARHTRAATLNDLSLELPEGVYTALRTYPGARVLHLDAHFDRLADSARLEGVELSLDAETLRKAIATTVASTGFPLTRVRVTVCLTPPTRIFVAAEEFQESTGGRVSLGRHVRSRRPSAAASAPAVEIDAVHRTRRRCPADGTVVERRAVVEHERRDTRGLVQQLFRHP